MTLFGLILELFRDKLKFLRLFVENKEKEREDVPLTEEQQEHIAVCASLPQDRPQLQIPELPVLSPRLLEDCDEASANDNNGEVEYITYNGERIKVAKKLTCYRTDCNHTVIKGSHFDRDNWEIFPAEKAKIKAERSSTSYS